jgi:hypothetical protein
MLSRLDVAPDYRLLVRLLRDPSGLGRLTPQEFSRGIDAADESRLLGWLLTQCDTRRLPDDPPEWLHERMITVRALVDEYERRIRWEVDRLRRALIDVDMPCALLKGAAYVAAKLPPGRGRRVADIDILVPEERLVEAERALSAHGWALKELNAYDTRYYREWMHQLPPLVHRRRGSVIDVHHAILPRTSRLQPPSPRLFEQAREVEPGVFVLSPAHMVLHGAAHLFHDGEIAGAIRDVVDLDALLRDFAKQPNFWTDLDGEAQQLGLTRPAYYALRYAQRLLGTPIPDDLAAIGAAAPPGPVRWLMDDLFDRTVPQSAANASSFAVFALYVRSHWLKMPPLMLVRHLLTKAVK